MSDTNFPPDPDAPHPGPVAGGIESPYPPHHAPLSTVPPMNVGDDVGLAELRRKKSLELAVRVAAADPMANMLQDGKALKWTMTWARKFEGYLEGKQDGVYLVTDQYSEEEIAAILAAGPGDIVPIERNPAGAQTIYAGAEAEGDDGKTG